MRGLEQRLHDVFGVKLHCIPLACKGIFTDFGGISSCTLVLASQYYVNQTYTTKYRFF